MDHRTSMFAGAVALALTASNAIGNGLSINEQSASAAGMSYAGRASFVEDASIVYGNPAGMGLLSGEQITSGFSLIDASSTITNARGAPGTAKGDMVPIVAIPFGFYVQPVSSRFTIGFGVYAPFGGETDYEHNFIGRYQGSLTKASVITFQPTASYRLNNHWSIGGGLTVNRLNGQIGSAASNAVLGGQGDSELLTKGEATSVGYNIGLLYNAEGNFSFGSTYHSKVGFRLTGATTINGANGLLGPIPALGLPGINGRYPASLSIITPESLDNSITYHVAPGWILSVGALWTRWDRFQNLNVSNQDIPTLYSQLNTLSEPLGWRNTWSYSVGASHQLSDALTIKAGLAYDPTPVPNKFMSVRVPTGDRKALSLGLQWQTNAKTKLDLAYGYINENAVEVDQATTLGGLRPGFQGKYKNHFNGISMQLSHAF